MKKTCFTLSKTHVANSTDGFKKGFTLAEGATHVANSTDGFKKGFTLAEGATHVAHSTDSFKKGFTLAEVLITLGIIGVVAAMTIPTLIANTNSSKFSSQFKKSLSTLNQAALMATAQHDTDYGTLAPASGETCTGTESLTSGNNTICGLFNATLAGATFVSDPTTLKANSKNYAVQTVGGKTISDPRGYQMADGSLVIVPAQMAGCTKATNLTLGAYLESVITPASGDTPAVVVADKCLGYIDVNGPTLPNKEVSCGTGSDAINADSHRLIAANDTNNANTCAVGKDTAHMTDIYPIVFYDQTVEPATVAAKAVLTGQTQSGAAN